MVLIGVLALQGAFEEHESALKACSDSVSTVQIRTAAQIRSLKLDGIVLPGGESTAMGLVGQVTESIWEELKKFINVEKRPAWGTCAGMILLAEKVVGASAVIVGGQAIIGGLDVLVCRNYFGSQISSFELGIPPPPSSSSSSSKASPEAEDLYPGVFIRAPAILSVSSDITVLSAVDAVPCRQANTTLEELDARISRGEDVTMLGVKATDDDDNWMNDDKEGGGEKKRRKIEKNKGDKAEKGEALTLPGATGKGGGRRVVCAARKGNVLCTSFHPELTDDLRWHEYFLRDIVGAKL
ncbi:hypothetical protein TrRE_jg7041 [Triparma retinervis]|uniref:glutaminase n=1 Tax=Triparma retinervis TaxID=2557542 RepID=A0A9W7CBE5_9STRA|nr:hypothetical protein TrRE_jg7041 [Triparma retinervis]